MSDPRFARLRTDPRFRRPKKSKQKVVVDERFEAVFDNTSNKKSTNTKEKSKGGRVDKYGRRISDTHEKDDLRRFYRLEGEESDKDEQAPAIVDYARGEVLLESSDDDEEGENENAKNDQESDEDQEVVLGRHASKPIPVLADEDEYPEVDLNEDDEAYADLDAQAAAYLKGHVEDNDADQGGVKTNRLAVVNLDWDHVRATHLYKIFSSLVSPTAPSASVAVNANVNSNADEKLRAINGAKIGRGKILSVRIYPSEFGKERMRKEEVEGPPKEIFKRNRRYDEDNVLGSLIQEDEGGEYDEKALRKYQLERLRYYYAIVTCDTVEAAAHLLAELDGSELERSANVFDLSYVPDDMTFDDEFRDEATPVTEIALTDYKGLDFSTDALRHSKVTLKWDEDDHERNKVTRRALSRKEIEENDYRAYIASSSSEDEGEERPNKIAEKSKAERERLRKLLLGGDGKDDLPEGWGENPFADEDKDADGAMEITFLPGLSEANAKAGEETTIEKYRRKERERRQARKKNLKEKASGEHEKETNGKKSRSKPIDDDFFAAESTSESDGDVEAEVEVESKHSKSKSKSKAKARQQGSEDPAEVVPATEAELELLVAPDDLSGERKHFDMKAILKAEKAKGKKKGNKKKKGKEDGEDEVQQDFHIDIEDERFKALHEDHTFAIDPSNPQFKKTKSMAALLEKRAKRQTGKDVRPEERVAPKENGSAKSQSLQSLVESVKRKSSNVEGKGVGKRRRL